MFLSLALLLLLEQLDLLLALLQGACVACQLLAQALRLACARLVWRRTYVQQFASSRVSPRECWRWCCL